MSEMLCFSQGWILGFALGFIPTMAWAIVRLRQATALWREAIETNKDARKALNEAREFRTDALLVKARRNTGVPTVVFTGMEAP